jgi:hypothetical protein
MLEDNGDSGSAGSHWERVSFGNEGMTASEMDGAVFSKFTLLLLQASGWYLADMKYAQPLTWSKGQGCNSGHGFCDNTLERCSGS